MSDLLIKGMDLSTDDIVSVIAVFSSGDVKFIDRMTFSSFYFPQKAIEVPSHGRLIDADKLAEAFKAFATGSEVGYLRLIDDAPTVLEASDVF